MSCYTYHSWRSTMSYYSSAGLSDSEAAKLGYQLFTREDRVVVPAFGVAKGRRAVIFKIRVMDLLPGDDPLVVVSRHGVPSLTGRSSSSGPPHMRHKKRHRRPRKSPSVRPWPATMITLWACTISTIPVSDSGFDYGTRGLAN